MTSLYPGHPSNPVNSPEREEVAGALNLAASHAMPCVLVVADVEGTVWREAIAGAGLALVVTIVESALVLPGAAYVKYPED